MVTKKKPITCQGDLTKLPHALAPLIERPQWCVWRHFAIAAATDVEKILRPNINAEQVEIAAMVQIDRGERISFGQQVRDAVGTPRLHRI